MLEGPLVASLFKLIQRSGLTLGYISRRSGVARATIQFWEFRSSPSLHNFLAVLNFLGYDLVIIKRNLPIKLVHPMDKQFDNIVD